jgi:sulfite oxidase
MLDRRTFLQTTGLSLALGLTRSALAGDAILVRQGGSPQNLATPLEYFDRAITPTPVFFVRSHFGPPSLDRARKLSIDGLVQTPLSLSVDDLRAFPEVTITAVLQCAGNGRGLIEPRVPGVQWTHGAMGQATWTGVRLRDVLAKAGVLPEGLHVQLAGADLPPKPAVPAFVRSVPLSRALDPSTILAYRMNGEPLTHAHGAPLRLVVPGWAGDHWMKWLVQIRVQKEEAEGFYMRTAYKFPIGPVTPGAAVPPDQMRSMTTFPVRSIIAKPADASNAPVGAQEIVGVAFSGEAPIAMVEISLDAGKTWRAAALEGEGGVGRWQVFRFRFTQKVPARLSALVRATDKRGSKQPQNAVWNPSGYHWNAWHSVTWEVG